MSMLSMATHLSSGSVGSFTHSAEPSSPSSSPENDANRIPRSSCPFIGANRRASSSTPAVPEALSSAPGWIWPICEGASELESPVAQVIVVRADDDVFVGLAGKIREHVVHPGVGRLDVNLQRELQRLRKRKRCRLAQVVDLLLHLGQRLARRLEPALGDRVLHLQQHDANVLRAAHAAEAHQQVLFAVAQLSVDEDHRLGAVIARVDGLGNQLRMLRQALVAALLAEDLGLVAEHQHDLVLHVHAGIIVVLKLVGRSAVAHEHDRTGDRTR